MWKTDISVWFGKPSIIQAFSDDGEEQDYMPERTCRIVKASRRYVLSDGTELFEDGCSECNAYLSEDDNYCPNCGAKVVDE